MTFAVDWPLSNNNQSINPSDCIPHLSEWVSSIYTDMLVRLMVLDFVGLKSINILSANVIVSNMPGKKRLAALSDVDATKMDGL